MKKLTALLLVFAFAFCLTACNGDDLGKQTKVYEEGNIVEHNAVGTFDFSEYKKENADKARTDGFKNTEPMEFHNKKNATILAEKELPEGYTYNYRRFYYDRTEGIWMVECSTVAEDGTVSGKINVCIEDTGYTRLIVEE